MQLGATIPVADIGTGPSGIKDYAQTIEGLGFDYLQAPDHVLGANPATIAGKGRVGTNENPYHDPFVLFGFLAGVTQRLHFAPGVLILAQRQAALVAKQAACLAVLSGDRLRLGVGVGWNKIEFDGLNEVFSNRGRRAEFQRCRHHRPNARSCCHGHRHDHPYCNQHAQRHDHNSCTHRIANSFAHANGYAHGDANANRFAYDYTHAYRYVHGHRTHGGCRLANDGRRGAGSAVGRRLSCQRRDWPRFRWRSDRLLDIPGSGCCAG